MKRYKIVSAQSTSMFKYGIYSRTWYWPFWRFLLMAEDLNAVRDIIEKDKWVKYYD